MTRAVSLILLASGRSERFGTENKLLASFQGAPLAAQSARLWAGRTREHRVVIVPPETPDLEALFRAHGWDIKINDAPERGQSSSLKIGVEAAQRAGAGAAVICLADMPFVTDVHLDALMTALAEKDAVMSRSGDILCPPAAFAAHTLERLLIIDGDKGARSVFNQLQNTATVSINARDAIDIDTPETLERLSKEPMTDG